MKMSKIWLRVRVMMSQNERKFDLGLGLRSAKWAKIGLGLGWDEWAKFGQELGLRAVKSAKIGFVRGKYIENWPRVRVKMRQNSDNKDNIFVI